MSDPSMDDILASIRRILDEEGSKASPNPAEPEVMELDKSMMVPDTQTAGSDTKPANREATLNDHPTSFATKAAPAPTPAGTDDPEAPIVAPAAAAAAATSIGSLLRTLASERNAVIHRGGPTIEDLVREEMRPMMKEWLDQHLAPVVERLVRAEIERVVSRMT